MEAKNHTLNTLISRQRILLICINDQLNTYFWKNQESEKLHK